MKKLLEKIYNSLIYQIFKKVLKDKKIKILFYKKQNKEKIIKNKYKI